MLPESEPTRVPLGGIPIDYRTEDFGRCAAGVDAVLNPIGGRNWLRSYRVLGNVGRFIGYGMSAAIEGGRRKMIFAPSSLAWLGLLGLIPGKSARWYNIMTEKKNIPRGSARIFGVCCPCFRKSRFAA
jgi:NADPH:quinone reductase-like Zn-dependent oxidoreductase